MTTPSPREPDAREALADELEACPAVPFLGVPGELKFIAAFAMTEANRDVIVAALREQPNEREREALADAPDDDDNMMRDDPLFNRGVTHVVDMLARITGAKNWHAGDGSEDYDCDLEETLRNILAAAGLYDKEEGVFAALRQPAAPGGEPDIRSALRMFVDWGSGKFEGSLLAQYEKAMNAALLALATPPSASGEAASRSREGER